MPVCRVYISLNAEDTSPTVALARIASIASANKLLSPVRATFFKRDSAVETALSSRDDFTSNI